MRPAFFRFFRRIWLDSVWSNDIAAVIVQEATTGLPIRTLARRSWGGGRRTRGHGFSTRRPTGCDPDGDHMHYLGPCPPPTDPRRPA
jgi:hypothetical protein